MSTGINTGMNTTQSPWWVRVVQVMTPGAHGVVAPSD